MLNLSGSGSRKLNLQTNQSLERGLQVVLILSSQVKCVFLVYFNFYWSRFVTWIRTSWTGFAKLGLQILKLSQNCYVTFCFLKLDNPSLRRSTCHLNLAPLPCLMSIPVIISWVRPLRTLLFWPSSSIRTEFLLVVFCSVMSAVPGTQRFLQILHKFHRCCQVSRCSQRTPGKDKFTFRILKDQMFGHNLLRSFWPYKVL